MDGTDADLWMTSAFRPRLLGCSFTHLLAEHTQRRPRRRVRIGACTKVHSRGVAKPGGVRVRISLTFRVRRRRRRFLAASSPTNDQLQPTAECCGKSQSVR